MLSRRLILLAHNIRSLWNVGSFFRTADGLNVEKIILTGYTGHPPRKEISKTAIGAEECVPWEKAEDPVDAIRTLRADGWRMVALELAPGARELSGYPPAEKTCLVVGHELTGVPEEILILCDDVVMIPMRGTKESLNVAVAAGIALHHLREAALP
jgi:23S rRNA (guanosine2251-2'-O)-methyltransferase